MVAARADRRGWSPAAPQRLIILLIVDAENRQARAPSRTENENVSKSEITSSGRKFSLDAHERFEVGAELRQLAQKFERTVRAALHHIVFVA